MINYNIQKEILSNQILPLEPYIKPMSTIYDQDIFEYYMKKYVGNVNCIIDVGSYVGLSSLFLSYYCNICHTFDIVDYIEKYKVWDHFNPNNIIFHHIKDNSEKIEILKKLPKIDFVLIDGWHKNGVDKDFEIFKGLCNKMLFHDYRPSRLTGNPDGLFDWMKNYLDILMKEAKIVDIKEPFVYMEFE